MLCLSLFGFDHQCHREHYRNHYSLTNHSRLPIDNQLKKIISILKYRATQIHNKLKRVEEMKIQQKVKNCVIASLNLVYHHQKGSA